MNEIIIIITIGILIFTINEVIIRNKILKANKNFQWMIVGKDERPNFSKNGLEKFFQHGYDSELGWIRKPETEHEEMGKNGKTMWHIDKNGARNNPILGYKEGEISCYGDSFTFARQVNDNETWSYFLSELAKTNIQNFGVGNYGIDQSLLRLKREFKKYPSNIVILGVVPDTISRILSVWKHYYEYGNTFGFKPRFKIIDGKLTLIKNFIDSKEKFVNYKKFLKEIQNNDFFYKEKFLKEIIRFPYSISILKNLSRNIRILQKLNKIEKDQSRGKIVAQNFEAMKIIMARNLEWRIKLFKDENASKLLKGIVQEYANFSQKENFKAVFVFLPQKDDIIFIKNNHNFYNEFVEEIRKIKHLVVLDITSKILKEEKLEELFSEKTEYGGHYSKYGNKIIAKMIYDEMRTKMDHNTNELYKTDKND